MQLQIPDSVTDRLVRAEDPTMVLQAVYSVMLARRRVPHVSLDPDLLWATPVLTAAADSTRKLRGYTAYIATLRLEAGVSGGQAELRELRRVMYQASIMTDRRERISKATRIYEAQGHALSGNAVRGALAQRQLAAWREQRDQYLRECADAAGRKLNWGERLAAIERFWDAIDDALDAQLKGVSQRVA